jgi:hypothetical protein
MTSIVSIILNIKMNNSAKIVVSIGIVIFFFIIAEVITYLIKQDNKVYYKTVEKDITELIEAVAKCPIFLKKALIQDKNRTCKGSKTHVIVIFFINF